MVRVIKFKVVTDRTTFIDYASDKEQAAVRAAKILAKFADYGTRIVKIKRTL
jgi:hypothetical protein